MRFYALPLLSLIIFMTSGCETRKHHENHDPTLKIKEEKYDQLLTAPPKVQKPKKVYKKKTVGEKPPQEMLKRVSISFTNRLPVQDVLMELGNQTRVSMVMDPNISGMVMVQAHNKPFISVIKQICAMAKLRYRIEGEVLYIEKDSAYLKNYNVQFLNLIRQNESKISVATDVFSAMHSDDYKMLTNPEIDNGSNTLLKGKTQNNFWEELELNLTMLLGDTKEGSTSYSLHKQAGIISIKAPSRIHQRMERFLKLLRDNITAQVLVEAKIIEVSLSDEYKSGINWHSVKTGFFLNAPLGTLATPGPFNPNVAPARDVFSIGANGRSLTSIASLLSKFGTVRTLSNPRITVSNNQPAVLKVATNQVFFQVDYNRELGNDNRPETERASSRIQTVPIGLVMLVQPSINTNTGKITLSLRPTISRVTSFKEDPAVGILTNNTRISQIPEIQVRELDSILNVGSGEVIVMGGLMEERSDNNNSGIPDAKKMPLFGPFLSSKDDTRTVTELVILLRVTILDNPEDSLSPADERVYTTFTKDPRPLDLAYNERTP